MPSKAPPNINTVIQRRVENPTSGSVKNYPDHCKNCLPRGRLRPKDLSGATPTMVNTLKFKLVNFQIFRRAGALLKITKTFKHNLSVCWYAGMLVWRCKMTVKSGNYKKVTLICVQKNMRFYGSWRLKERRVLPGLSVR